MGKTMNKALFVAVLLTVAIIAGLPALLGNPGDPGLVLYMPFDGLENTNTVAVDASGYGNNGAVDGATFVNTGGKYGGGYHFDGADDAIVIPDAPVLNPGSEITMEMWVYFDNDRYDNNPVYHDRNMMLLDKMVWSQLGYSVWVDGNTKRIWWNVGGSDLSSYQGNIWSVGSWQHIAVTADSNGKTSLYFNGLPVYMSTNLNWAGSLTLAEAITLGREGTRAFNGTLDELRIYNYARTPAQIYTDYLTDPTAVPAPDMAVVDSFFVVQPQIGVDASILTIVQNVGDLAGTATVEIRVDGGIADLFGVSLAPGEDIVLNTIIVGTAASHDIQVNVVGVVPDDRDLTNNGFAFTQAFSTSPPPPQALSCTKTLANGMVLGMGGPACSDNLLWITCEVAGPGTDTVDMGNFKGEAFGWDIECQDGNIWHYATA